MGVSNPYEEEQTKFEMDSLLQVVHFSDVVSLAGSGLTRQPATPKYGPNFIRAEVAHEQDAKNAGTPIYPLTHGIYESFQTLQCLTPVGIDTGIKQSLVV